MGTGNDLDEAREALLAEARLMAEDLRELSPAELSTEASALRAFVMGLP